MKGIAVIDLGATNIKAALVDKAFKIVTMLSSWEGLLGAGLYWKGNCKCNAWRSAQNSYLEEMIEEKKI